MSDTVKLYKPDTINGVAFVLDGTYDVNADLALGKAVEELRAALYDETFADDNGINYLMLEQGTGDEKVDEDMIAMLVMEVAESAIPNFTAMVSSVQSFPDSNLLIVNIFVGYEESDDEEGAEDGRWD